MFLVIYRLEKCYFILMHSANFDQFQLIALALIQITCWLIKSGRFGEGGGVLGGRVGQEFGLIHAVFSAHLLLSLF
jgi:hypothetical protein